MIIFYLKAIVLGCVQGITEFLPVSSTAHLIVLQNIFHLDEKAFGLTFDMFTNLGTTIALIWYFWSDIVYLLKKLRLPSLRKPLEGDERIPWWIVGATVFPAVCGVLLEEKIATTFRSLWVIVFSLVIVGLAMIMAERLATAAASKKEADGKAWYVMGAAQVLAFLPGVSRSGATITTGMYMGLSRERAARTSFLLSIPILAAASLKRIASFAMHFSEQGLSSSDLWFYAIATVTSLIIGYLTVKYLMRYLQGHSLATFSYYRFILAFLVVLLIIR